MPASVMVGFGEAKGMATKQKASRAITKKELAYLLSRLCTVDATLAGRCGVTAFRFLSLSLLLSPRRAPSWILGPRVICANSHRARGKAGRARCASTRSTLRLFYMYAQRPQREIPHLRKCPYKEGVGTAQNQMPLHVVGRFLPPFEWLMGSWWKFFLLEYI